MTNSNSPFHDENGPDIISLGPFHWVQSDPITLQDLEKCWDQAKSATYALVRYMNGRPRLKQNSESLARFLNRVAICPFMSTAQDVRRLNNIQDEVTGEIDYFLLELFHSRRTNEDTIEPIKLIIEQLAIERDLSDHKWLTHLNAFVTTNARLNKFFYTLVNAGEHIPYTIRLDIKEHLRILERQSACLDFDPTVFSNPQNPNLASINSRIHPDQEPG